MPHKDLIEFKTGSGSRREAMFCPRCGSDYLRHQSVTYFDRPEDAETVLETSISCGETKIKLTNSAASRNPSARRDGIEIVFTCEGCKQEGNVSLFVSQHKGQSEVFWEC